MMSTVRTGLVRSVGPPSRRQFLWQALGGTASIVILPTLSRCFGSSLEPPVVKEPLPSPAWLDHARIANFTAWTGIETSQLRAQFDDLAAQNVSVLEIDLALYHYEPDSVFASKMTLLNRIAKAAHKWGMRCVVYYSAGEVITENATNIPNTMSKDHPDWLQVALDGTLISFTGGGVVYWVADGEESSWMCPTSGFADYYLQRVRQVAATAVDGIWVDVPLFPDDVAPMPCTNPSCAAQFASETGLTIPRLGKGTPFSPTLFADQTFRRWVRWRHDILHRFLLRIVSAAQSVRADFKIIVETVTCDSNRATNFGLDAGFADETQLYRVWEVSPLDDARGMHDAYADDWICLLTMMKYGQGAALPKSTWAFTYGDLAEDAEYVMGLAVNAGVCPFECKIPEMTQSVDPAYRARVFGFIAENTEVYGAVLERKAAVLYSSASRDFLDRNAGQGIMYSEGGFGPQDSVVMLPYLGDYRGCCRALLHAHVPYSVVTESTLTAQNLKQYTLLVVPSPLALSDSAIAVLAEYATSGGCLLVTGPDGGSYDLLGAARSGAALLTTLGVNPLLSGWQVIPWGTGTVIYAASRAGHSYITQDDLAILAEFAAAAKRCGAQLVTDAARSVVIDLRSSADGRQLYLLCTSLVGLGSRSAGVFAPTPASFTISLPLSGRQPTRVTTASLSANATNQNIPFSLKADQISFQLASVGALLVATVSF